MFDCKIKLSKVRVTFISMKILIAEIKIIYIYMFHLLKFIKIYHFYIFLKCKLKNDNAFLYIFFNIYSFNSLREKDMYKRNHTLFSKNKIFKMVLWS